MSQDLPIFNIIFNFFLYFADLYLLVLNVFFSAGDLETANKPYHYWSCHPAILNKK